MHVSKGFSRNLHSKISICWSSLRLSFGELRCARCVSIAPFIVFHTHTYTRINTHIWSTWCSSRSKHARSSENALLLLLHLRCTQNMLISRRRDEKTLKEWKLAADVRTFNPLWVPAGQLNKHTEMPSNLSLNETIVKNVMREPKSVAWSHESCCTFYYAMFILNDFFTVMICTGISKLPYDWRCRTSLSETDLW